MFREVRNTVSIHTFYLQTSQDPSTGLVVMHCYTELQHNLKKKKIKVQIGTLGLCPSQGHQCECIGTYRAALGPYFTASARLCYSRRNRSISEDL